MVDQRLTKLADSLVNYSLNIKKGEVVEVICKGFQGKPLVLEVVKELQKVKAIPIVKYEDAQTTSLITKNSNEEAIKLKASLANESIKTTNAFIYILALENDYESSTIPKNIHELTGKYFKDYNRTRVNERKWVLLNYPTSLFAHKAKMTFEDFANYSLDVMSVDYKKMSDAFKPLKKLMEKTDKVRIVSPGTDLSFSIKDIEAVPCAGECNIPDGEIFTAPVRTSVNGTIQYNTPSPYRGKVFENIKLTFKDGKITDCDCSNYPKKDLEEIFNTDEGARYVGEFAIGVNPLVTKPMGDILYDEKIAGSLHFTPGEAYEEANNGNKSSVHWDLVLIQTKEYGGGQIFFDDVLIRENGIFVLDELKCLNPENLK